MEKKQTLRDEELVSLLHHAGGQNGVEESIVFGRLAAGDDLGVFADFVVIVEKGQQLADGRPGESVGRNTRKQSIIQCI